MGLHSWITQDCGNWRGKDIKGMQNGKKEVKLSLCADGITLYTENPKDTIKKLLGLIN